MTQYQAEVVQTDTAPPSWTVELVDSDDDGGVDVTVFSGPNAEHRAHEYARWKYGMAQMERVA